MNRKAIPLAVRNTAAAWSARPRPEAAHRLKYMRVTSDASFKNEPMDGLNKMLFTFTSYNVGPGRVRQLRREAARVGLEPDPLVRTSNRSRPRGSAARR